MKHETTGLKQITIKHRTIKKGYCSCLDCKVFSKVFDLNLRKNLLDDLNDFDISLTEDKIIYFLNKAESFEIMEDKTGTILKIVLEDWDIYATIEKIKGGVC